MGKGNWTWDLLSSGTCSASWWAELMLAYKLIFAFAFSLSRILKESLIGYLPWESLIRVFVMSILVMLLATKLLLLDRRKLLGFSWRIIWTSYSLRKTFNLNQARSRPYPNMILCTLFCPNWLSNYLKATWKPLKSTLDELSP